MTSSIAALAALPADDSLLPGTGIDTSTIVLWGAGIVFIAILFMAPGIVARSRHAQFGDVFKQVAICLIAVFLVGGGYLTLKKVADSANTKLTGGTSSSSSSSSGGGK